MLMKNNKSMDNYRMKAVSNQNIFAIVFFSLVSLQYAFINTDFEFTGVVSTLFFVLEVTACFICLVMTKCDIHTFAKIVVIFIISFISYTKTHETVFIIELLASIMFIMIDTKDLFKLLFYERLILLLFIMLCSFTGVLPFNVVNIFKGGTTPATVVGYAFGYDHPNQFAGNVCFLIISYICYKNERIKVRNIISIFIASLFVYIFSKSRTLLAITAFIILMLFFLKSKIASDKLKKILDVIAPLILPAFATASMIFPLSMATATGRFREYLWAFNGLIGSRFTHSARVFSTYRVPLWGGINQFNELQNLYSYSVVDSGYVNLLYDFGIVGFAIFIILYIFAIKKLLMKQEYVYVIATIAVFLWGFTENVLRSFGMNFTVVFWGLLLIHDTKQKRRRKVRVTI